MALRSLCAWNKNPHTIVMHPWLVKHVRMYRLNPRDVIEGIVFGDSNRYIMTEQGKLEICTYTIRGPNISAHAAPSVTASGDESESSTYDNDQANRGALTYAAQPL